MAEKQYKYSKDEILQRTNGGLDVILHYYPEAATAGNRPKNFSLGDISAEDNNPSSAIVPGSINKGYVIVKEFNNANKRWSCFDIVAAKENLTNFGDICAFIFENIIGESRDANKNIGYEFKMRLAKEDEKLGDYWFDFNENFSKDELQYFGPYVTAGLLRHFNIKSVDKFHQVIQLKNKKTESYKKYGEQPVKMVKGATNGHFIFAIDKLEDEKFAKIYTPQTKDFRFQYVGDKPTNFCFGLDTIPDLWEDHIQEEWDRLLMKYADKKDPEKEIAKNHGFEQKEDIKLPEIIIAGGDRDAINVASMGYPVVWLNSETANYDSKLHNHLKGYAYRVIQLGDIDDVGIKQMNDRAKAFIDLYTLYLPESLRQPKLGSHSKPGKDLTDWVKRTYDHNNPDLAKNIFGKMVKNDAYPAKFWEAKYEGGKFKRYDINNEYLMHFLQLHGFHKMKIKGENKDQEETSENNSFFVHLKNNVLRIVTHDDITNYPLHYVKQRSESVTIKNLIHRSPQITEKKLQRLNYIDVDPIDNSKDHQYLYFKDAALRIEKDEIKLQRYENIDGPVWESKILDHFISGVNNEKPFEIWKDKNGNWDVKIIDKQNPFIEYLVNASRIHWKKNGYYPFIQRIEQLKMNETAKSEDERLTDDQLQAEIDKILDEMDQYRKEHNMQLDEPGLTAHEVGEQKRSFANKIFAFGFTLHNYRAQSKPWFPIAMDNEVNETNDGKRNGRTGKSLLFNKTISYIVNTSDQINAGEIDQKNQDQFIFDNVNKLTTNICWDDANKYFPYDKQLFQFVTGSPKINRKHKGKIVLDARKRPIPAVTSNHGMPNLGPSFDARVIYVPFADFYHGENKEEYLRDFGVADGLGQELFNDFDTKQWQQFYNTVAHCIQFAMNQDKKINPPMENVDKRNLQAQIGDNFIEAADSFFFADPAKRLNNPIDKQYCYDEIMGARSNVGANKFKEKIKLWCKYHNIEFNPPEKVNTKTKKGNARLVKRPEQFIVDRYRLSKDQRGYASAREHFYIKTNSNFDIFLEKSKEENDQPGDQQSPDDQMDEFLNDDDIDENEF